MDNAKHLNEDEIQQMIEDALDHLSYEEYENAMTIARELISAEYAEGYEIASKVLSAREQHEEAVELLETGTEKFPDDYALWVALGSALTELEGFEEALHAFAKASQCPDANVDFVELNEASTYLLMEEYSKCMEICERLKSNEDLYNSVLSIKAEALLSQGKAEELIKMAETELDQINAPLDTYDDPTLSDLYLNVAYAYYNTDPKHSELEYYIRKALQFDRMNEDAHELYRKIRNNIAENGTLYRVFVHATFTTEEGEEPVRTSYELVAGSPKEALEIIEKTEIDALTDIELIDYEKMSVAIDQLKGIYIASEFIYEDEELS